MTQVENTPAEDKNVEGQVPLTDNMGNPINEDGSPREVVKEPEETVESLRQQLKDTKAELTKHQQANKEVKDPVEEPKEPTAEDKALEEAESKGVDVDKYSQEIDTNGELSEDSYAELEAKGFSRELVDNYIEGQKARMDGETKAVADAVGGLEKFDALKEWAAENLKPAEITAFNKAVQSGRESAILAVQGLNSRYVQENGASPKLITGDGQSGNSTTYKSSFEMTKAMEDPRYWSDPDYQKEVAAKTQRSIQAGTI